MHLFLCAFFVQVALSTSTLVNRTIDDTKGDSVSGLLPIYSPPAQFSPNSNCPTCKVRLDPARVFDGTWHDSSQLRDGPPVSVALSFNGTAIYIVCVLANTVKDAVTSSDFVFTLDGSRNGSFTHKPTSSPDYIYGANVFSVNGLEQGPHEVVLTTDNSTGSLLLFDYASYTSDERIGAPPAISPVTGTTASGLNGTAIPHSHSTISGAASFNAVPISSFAIASPTPRSPSISPLAPPLPTPSPPESSSGAPGSSVPNRTLSRILHATLIFVLVIAIW
ncbi:hypothetical protein B0H17DRAFT_1199171 [Mycena rosella]|uniref:Uncharacterized protein n=1 Tax=Mycena rosella TaxID=1033263 RepID=A0AAD7DNC3_MYCRO|nr:hypothetical protein B0H17DRAFT_1199171 [Mycena rosella]